MTDINTLTQSGWYETNHDKYKYIYLELEPSQRMNKLVFSGCLSVKGVNYFPQPNQVYKEPDNINMFCVPINMFSIIRHLEGTLLPLELTSELIETYKDPENIVLSALCINLFRYASILDLSVLRTRDTLLGNLVYNPSMLIVAKEMFEYFQISSLDHKDEFDKLASSNATINIYIDTILDLINL